jgi:hypothetical protein
MRAADRRVASSTQRALARQRVRAESLGSRSQLKSGVRPLSAADVSQVTRVADALPLESVSMDALVALATDTSSVRSKLSAETGSLLRPGSPRFSPAVGSPSAVRSNTSESGSIGGGGGGGDRSTGPASIPVPARTPSVALALEDVEEEPGTTVELGDGVLVTTV